VTADHAAGLSAGVLESAPGARAAVRPRVISLLPSGTEIVAALGAIDSLVGVTHECDYPPAVAALPRVTASVVDSAASSAEIDAQVRALYSSGVPLFSIEANDLVRLAPTLILTQTLCDVCAVTDGDVRSVASVLDVAPQILPLTGRTLSGVWEDIRAVGAALGVGEAASQLISEIEARFQRVHERLKAERAPRPRVAVIEWLEPLYVAGHWTPELVRRAGGIDVLAEAGAHSVRVSVDQVRDADPEIVIFAPCGFGVERAAREAALLLEAEEWAWAEGVECWAIDGNALTSRPGPRLADAVEVIAAIVAPELFEGPSEGFGRRVDASARGAGLG
jgi:iron complex transport system substrate-binding protein